MKKAQLYALGADHVGPVLPCQLLKGLAGSTANPEVHSQT